MQTFLPYKSFSASAHCLDYKRLGKQRVEAKQIYLALSQPGYGWQNHPAVLMWADYKPALLLYGVEICLEWRSRAYKDEQLTWFEERLEKIDPATIEIPHWLTNSLIRSHRSNLLRKYPAFYRQYNWNVSDDLEYIWPVRSRKPIGA